MGPMKWVIDPATTDIIWIGVAYSTKHRFKLLIMDSNTHIYRYMHISVRPFVV